MKGMMSPELQVVHNAARTARIEAQKDIVWQYMSKIHELGQFTRVAKDGVIEVSLKYLKSVMPFFSEGVIQQSMYSLQEENLVVADRDKGFGSCVKWYRVK